MSGYGPTKREVLDDYERNYKGMDLEELDWYGLDNNPYLLKLIALEHGLPITRHTEDLFSYSKMKPIDLLLISAEQGDVRVVKSVLGSVSRQWLLDNSSMVGESLFNAAVRGHLDVVRAIQEASYHEGIPSYTADEIMDIGGRNGHIQIVDYALSLGAEDYDRAAALAASNGHLGMVEYMLNKGADDYDQVMTAAAEGGYMKIVELMLSKGAKEYARAMIYAARHGHKEIVELMVRLGISLRTKDYSRAMSMAARGGYLEMVELMLKLDGASFYAEDYDKAMIAASKKRGFEPKGQRREIVQLMVSLGAVNYDKVMAEADMKAAEINREGLTKSDFNSDMIEAAARGDIETIGLMLALGADSFSYR